MIFQYLTVYKKKVQKKSYVNLLFLNIKGEAYSSFSKSEHSF